MPQLSSLPTATLGFPRMGPKRELKFALEKYWKGLLDKEGLLLVARTIEESAWKIQSKAGLSKIAVGDYVLYDQVVAWTEWLGLIPQRFQHLNRGIDLQFSMARGRNEAAALDMTKWFDTNYHYEVPELRAESKPEANFSELLEKVKRAVSLLGVEKVSPVILGPVTYLRLSKIVEGEENLAREKVLGRLLPAYKALFSQLKALGVTEVQIHEPALVMPSSDSLRKLFEQAYDPSSPSALLPLSDNLKVNMVTYFEDVGESNYQWLCSLPVQQVSLDFTRGDTLSLLLKHGFPADKTLGAGVVDGRNVWKMNPEKVTRTLQQIFSVAKKVVLQPSCSLQHVPWDVNTEKEYVGPSSGSKNIRPFLSFALQKLEELRTLSSYDPELSSLKDQERVDVYASAWKDFSLSLSASNSEVPARVARMAGDKASMTRSMPYEQRRPLQLSSLPVLPTTTIGSFPQTSSIRQLRQDFRKGIISLQEYQHGIDKQIAYAIGVQEGLGLDILVHGEAERTDMVEFFGEKLEGMAFSTNGWVQSYGSRCVRPPILCDNISRSKAMTVREFTVAQSLTKKPVKGMLTGPVTILNWSFPRVDIPRREQAYQLSLCIRDEIQDLEEAGCKVIQVDEPALREGMPLKQGKKQEYLDWAVNAFLLSTAGAGPATQIHTHMCYCEFEDCMEAIDRLDTDVNSIENARSSDATLRAFKALGYTKGLGPGVYDIHSPVVPTVQQMKEKIEGFLKVLPASQLVVNPDCGLKTRTWDETIPALKNMVEAAAYFRQKLEMQ